MEIRSFPVSAGHPITVHGSAGMTAQAMVRGEEVAVTVLHVAAGGRIGRHPAVGDQLFLVTAGHGAVQGGDGVWQPISAGQAALWRSGEEHTTRADADLTAVVIEMAELPMR